MRIRYWLLPKGSEESVFKAVPDGWVLSGANPWVFRSSRCYFVTNAQKPEVAAKIRRKMYVNIITAVLASLVIVAAGIKYNWWISASATDFAVLGVLLIIVNSVAAIIDNRLMRPIVRDLPRATDRVGMLDRWTSMSRSMSTRSLVLSAVAAAAGAAGNLYVASAKGLTIGWFGGSFLAFLSIAYGYALFLRLRDKAVNAA